MFAFRVFVAFAACVSSAWAGWDPRIIELSVTPIGPKMMFESPVLPLENPRPSIQAGESLKMWANFAGKGLRLTDTSGSALEKFEFAFSGADPAPSFVPVDANFVFVFRYTYEDVENKKVFSSEAFSGGDFGASGDIDLTSSSFVACGIQLIVTLPDELPDEFVWNPTGVTLSTTADNIEVVECEHPGASEDPHLKSWRGEWFDYHGECDLKLIHVPVFDGINDLDIHIRTTIRYGYSFIEQAALRLGNETLEISSWGEYAVNAVDSAMVQSNNPGALRKGAAISTLGGYPIYHTEMSAKKHVFDVVIGKDENITISNMKDFVNVQVRGATKAKFGSVVGLLGDLEGNLLARDGTTDLGGDAIALGQEWQVREDEPMLFRSVRSPQYPTKCRLPDTAKMEARRLGEGITEEVAGVACAHLKEDSNAFAACVYDVTATNDLDHAQSGAY